MTAVYATATAFRQALETRIKDVAKREGTDIQRLRRQIAFDRFLCRLFRESGDRWVLKGGYAMELRLTEGRTTRDIDLVARTPIPGTGLLADRLLRLLQVAVALDMGDFFHFAIAKPIKDLAGPPYGGARYPVEARMDGRIFARFHLDVATGDPVLEPKEAVQGRDWFGFAGVPTRSFPVISKEQQFVEKLHAYTLPRAGTANTRVRDLVDMYLLVRLGLEAKSVGRALHAVFARRKTHELPAVLPLPPDEWMRPFAVLAEECSVEVDSRAAFDAVARFVGKLQ